MSAYYRHPEINRATAIRLVKRNREYIDNYLTSHPCVDCGEKDIVVLDFDHVRGIKEIEVTRMIKRNSLKKIDEEIKKCEVRCANCHRRRHKKASIAQQ